MAAAATLTSTAAIQSQADHEQPHRAHETAAANGRDDFAAVVKPDSHACPSEDSGPGANSRHMTGSQACRAALSPTEPTLLDHLLTWRARRARALGLGPTAVAPSWVLQAVAAQQPLSILDLEETVRGWQACRRNTHGHELLGVVRAWVASGSGAHGSSAPLHDVPAAPQAMSQDGGPKENSQVDIAAFMAPPPGPLTHEPGSLGPATRASAVASHAKPSNAGASTAGHAPGEHAPQPAKFSSRYMAMQLRRARPGPGQPNPGRRPFQSKPVSASSPSPRDPARVDPLPVGGLPCGATVPGMDDSRPRVDEAPAAQPEFGSGSSDTDTVLDVDAFFSAPVVERPPAKRGAGGWKRPINHAEDSSAPAPAPPTQPPPPPPTPRPAAAAPAAARLPRLAAAMQLLLQCADVGSTAGKPAQLLAASVAALQRGEAVAHPWDLLPREVLALHAAYSSMGCRVDAADASGGRATHTAVPGSHDDGGGSKGDAPQAAGAGSSSSESFPDPMLKLHAPNWAPPDAHLNAEDAPIARERQRYSVQEDAFIIDQAASLSKLGTTAQCLLRGPDAVRKRLRNLLRDAPATVGGAAAPGGSEPRLPTAVLKNLLGALGHEPQHPPSLAARNSKKRSAGGPDGEPRAKRAVTRAALRAPGSLPLRARKGLALAGAVAPSDFSDASPKQLRAFLREAGAQDLPLPPAVPAAGVKGRPGVVRADPGPSAGYAERLLAAATIALPAWEVRRVLACRELPAGPARHMAVLQHGARVPPCAGHAERARALQASYRRLSLLVHPDKHVAGGCAAAHAPEAFQLLQEARAALLNGQAQHSGGL